MKIFAFILVLISCHSIACDGGMTMNRIISIPENSLSANDMTEKEFKDSIKSFEHFFAPSIDRDHNAELILFGSWSSNTVNAYAEQSDKKIMVTIYGGLARHKAITKDGFTAVLCHELGHHFGGYPKKSTNKWSSAEGQADYYASMKCLRRLWEKENNQLALGDQVIPAALKNECAQTYSDEKNQILCQRMGLAGRSVSLMIQDLDHDSIEPKFETPDPLVVRAMNYLHPYAQCRLDTFFQGAICPVAESVEFEDDDQTKGACHVKLGDTRGLRPKCWFVSSH
ncbi:MAG: M48 family metalloprotease [Bdellovibrionales bacterium]|nr:M48 family metalloprotease [Bdellovibrionales bacterium]